MRTAMLVMFLVLASACVPPDHVESYGFLLETQYSGVIPDAQQGALVDDLVTQAEVEGAVTASLSCMGAIDGVVVDEQFNWRDDGIEFGGGAHPIPGTDESVLVPLMDDCYYEYAALVETAWADQEHYGAFTSENKLR